MPAGFRIVVSGAPDYADVDFVFQVLDAVNTRTPIACLIELCHYPQPVGGYTPDVGADYLASRWVLARGQGLTQPIHWHRAVESPQTTAVDRIAAWKPGGVILFGRSVKSDELAAAAINQGVKVWRPVR